MKILNIVGMAALLMTFAFQNCSGVNFSSTPNQNTGTDNTPGGGGGGGEPPTNPTTCTPTSGNTPIITTLPSGVTTAQINSICPSVHDDTICGVVIIFGTNGQASLYFPQVNGKNEGPYDGNDDTLVGVLNLSSTAITSLALASDRDIFNFDKDGIDTYNSKLSNAMDTTGYGGNNGYYTNATPNFQSGTVNFISPVAVNNGTTFFGLENALTSTTSCLTITPN